MRRDRLLKQAKMVMAAIIGVLLLPYFIMTIFSGGKKESYAVQQATKDYISIRVDGDITEIAFEDYVAGVAAKQIDTELELEAIKAQVVITRTNLKKQQETSPGKLLAEDYISLGEMEKNGTAEKMIRAAEETSGKVIRFEERLVFAPFHAISAGQTRAGDVLSKDYGWLEAVSSSQDVAATRYLNIELITEKRLRRRIEKASGDILTEEALLEQIEVLERDKSEYVTSIRLGKEKMTGEKFREVLNLNSSCFYIEEVDEKIRITTKGLGHGLGYSQYGGNVLALEGLNYIEILQYYFPKCIIV